MRRLISKEERERQRKRNQVTVGAILVFLMVASTLGYAIQSNLGNDSGNFGTQNSGELDYNGFKFSYINGFWVLGNFVFTNSPEDAPNLGFGLNDAQSYQNKPFYISSESEEAEIEATLNLRQIAERVQRACTEESNCTDELPIKTCSDNFIIIKESSISDVRQEGNCVYIEGPKEELVRLVDGFLYKILGVK